MIVNTMSNGRYKKRGKITQEQVVNHVIQSPIIKTGVTEINNINKKINELKQTLANRPDVWNKVFNKKEYNEMQFLQSNLRGARSQLQHDIITEVNNTTDVFSVDQLNNITNQVISNSMAIQLALGEIKSQFREVRKIPEPQSEQKNQQIKTLVSTLRNIRVTDIESVRLRAGGMGGLLKQSDLLKATNAGRPIRREEIAIIIANELKLPKEEVLKRMKELNL